MDLRRLTFLRFVAAFAIVVFHFGRECPSLAWGRSLWAVANTATSFFFVLSGFILVCVYGERASWTRAEFYVARIARIAPLYLLATLPPLIWLRWHGAMPWTDCALVVLLLQAWVPGHAMNVANPPAWSLSVEAFFYLLFPFAAAAVAGIRSARALVAGMVVLWAANQYLHWSMLQPFAAGQGSAWLWDAAQLHPLGHLATFLGGMLGGQFYLLHGQRCRRAAPWLVIGSIAALVALASSEAPFLGFSHNGLFAPLFYLCVLGVAQGEGRAFALLTSPPLLLLGEISYGIYILQMPAHALFLLAGSEAGWAPSADVAFWSFAGLLVMLSWLSWRFVETPLRRRINGLVRQRPEARTAS